MILSAATGLPSVTAVCIYIYSINSIYVNIYYCTVNCLRAELVPTYYAFGFRVSAVRKQVIVSGPSGFVFFVETMLADLGVPSRAIVLLD